MVLAKATFGQQLATAYQHLYDLVYLRSHPLADILIPDPAMRRKHKAWLLHDILVNVIEELDPGPQAPILSREWRRYRLLTLRYTDGLDPQAVAQELAISRRHYYREHDAALEAITSVLWDRYMQRPAPPENVAISFPRPGDDDRRALLRKEAARLNQTGCYSPLAEVIASTVEIIREMANQKGIQIEVALHEPTTRVCMDRNILRQVLLGLLSYQVEQMAQGTIRIGEDWRKGCVLLLLHSQGQQTTDIPELDATTDASAGDVHLSILGELAAMQEAQIQASSDASGLKSFQITLPAALPRTILVVDDNADVLELFRRYLQQHHYQIMPTQSSNEALQLAQEVRPHAIILDLMLPERDGWDVLQTLTNQPATQHIPIIICTVLSAKSLAFALGAAAFLEKPVTEQTLLETLNTLEIAL